ncbi:hypothetical protein PRZ48_010840 [Zasmidium cellare]|uniref:Uncharacterized protein n=1 Tax=Zasmidium cellare TaxID=395010 RepID=A0ABR0E9R4_ZASCE|nr:hypothetical protein PRZ48_010840 [Zasmidium cellare]
MPMPTQQSPIPRNDSFSAEDLTKALKASATKPRNELSLRIANHDEPAVPPPSPRESRPAKRNSSPNDDEKTAHIEN